MKNLHVYAGAEHPHGGSSPVALDVARAEPQERRPAAKKVA